MGSEREKYYRRLNVQAEREAFFKRATVLLARFWENDGNVRNTAKVIGMERSHLHRKLKELSRAEK